MNNIRNKKVSIACAILVFVVMLAIFAYLADGMLDIQNIVRGNLTLQIKGNIGAFILPEKVRGSSSINEELFLLYFFTGLVSVLIIETGNKGDKGTSVTCALLFMTVLVEALLLICITFSIPTDKLAEIKQNGTYDNIVHEYFNQNYKKEGLYVSEDGTIYSTVYEFDLSTIDITGDTIPKEIYINDLELKYITHNKDEEKDVLIYGESKGDDYETEGKRENENGKEQIR